MSLKVYGFPNTRSLRVTWALEELGLDYEYHKVDLAGGETRTSEYREIHSGGKVPALVTEGGALSESLAIVNYLAALKPDAALVPEASPFKRALYDQWSLFALTELEQPLWTMGKHKFALPKDQRRQEIFATAEWEFQKALAIFSDGLGDKPYILGEEFCAADILLAHTLFWGMAFKQEIAQENLRAYMGRLGARPALAAARNRENA